MSRLSKPNTALEESRPFQEMSTVHKDAAGVDIGAHEIMVSIPGAEHTQLVRSFGNYTADLYAIAKCLGNTIFIQWQWKARECIGFHYLKFWNLKSSNAF